jgi:hypothetical protein
MARNRRLPRHEPASQLPPAGLAADLGRAQEQSAIMQAAQQIPLPGAGCRSRSSPATRRRDWVAETDEKPVPPDAVEQDDHRPTRSP